MGGTGKKYAARFGLAEAKNIPSLPLSALWVEFVSTFSYFACAVC